MRSSPLSSLRLPAVLLLGFLLSACSGNKKAGFEKSAKAYFDAGEYDKAKIEYLNLLREDAANATAIKQLGIMWMEEGAPARALPFLKETRKNSPADIPVRLLLAKALLAVGDMASARDEALDILKGSPSAGEALLMLVAAVTKPEDLAAARQRLEAFPDKNSPHYFLTSAALLIREKNIAGAEAAIQSALRADPKSMQAYSTQAGLFLARKDPAGAEKALKTAADLSPVRSAERIKYAEFTANSGNRDGAISQLAELTKKAPDFLSAWILSAQLSQSAKDFDAALASLQNVLSRDPDNFLGRVLQADILMGKGETAKAIEALEKLAGTYPAQPMVQYQLGRARFKNGEVAKAATALSLALASIPNHDFPEAILLLAEVNLRKGLAAEVESAMTAFLKKRPDSVAAASHLASALQAQAKYDEAVGVLEKLVANNTSSNTYRIRLGRVFGLKGEVGKARAVLSGARLRSPNDIAPAAELIDLELTAGKDTEAALKIARELTENSPKSGEAHYWVGRVFFAKGAWSEAETVLQRAIELDANFVPAYDLLIQTYLRQQKLPQAQERLQQLLSKNSKNLQALRLSGLIAEQQKDYAKAKERYEQFIALSPENPTVLNNLACLYSDQFDMPAKALELSTKARALRPGADAAASAYSKAESASIADTLGWISYRNGKYQEALVLAGEAAGELTGIPEVQYHLGMAASMMGRKELAADALEKAAAAPADFPGKAEIKGRLALLKPAGGQAPGVESLTTLLKAQPKDVLILILLAEAREKQNQVKEAAAAWEDALLANPKLSVASLNLVRLYSGPLKDPVRALKLAQDTYSAEPSPESAGVLGILLYEGNDYAKAYPLLKTGAEFPKASPPVFYALAWAAYSQSRVSDATAAMQQFLKMETGTPRAEKA
ncbi:MAG TPA: tetratricopeptide repeat protein, partial [Verrucomicrobiales bacterium]|nr:tetratricopeptide repeat protein [Verrucomicrobiales bacterium]